MRHVIIGAGPAGVAAAETLRKVGPTDEVVQSDPNLSHRTHEWPFRII